jgi:hypothetical protein
MNYGQNTKFSTIVNVAVSQFRGITAAGSYATTGLNFYGVNDQKPVAGDHVGAIVSGETKLQVSSGGLAIDDQVSITTSGYGTKCLSGGYSVGKCIFAATSGGIANVYLYGGPAYINA